MSEGNQHTKPLDGTGSPVSDCSACGGLGMIPGTGPDDDIMNTRCPECAGHPTTNAHAYCCGGNHWNGTHYEMKTPIGGAVPTDIAREFEFVARFALRELDQIRTEQIAASGHPKAATCISAARVALRRACQPNAQGEAQPSQTI